MSALEELKKASADLQAAVDRGAPQDEMDRRVKETLQKSEEVQRQAGWAEDDPAEPSKHPIKTVLLRKAETEPVRQFHESNDAFVICKSLSSALRRDVGVGHFADHLRKSLAELKKAMDSATAAEGLEFIPDEFSATFVENYRLQLKVAALFDRIDMPRSPWTLPIAGADVIAALAGEALTDDTSTESNFIPAVTPATAKKQMVAKKLAARVVWSDEFDAGAEVEMIGVGQDYLGLEVDEFLLGEGLDAGLGGNREERGRIEGPAANGDAAGSGTSGVSVLDAEGKHAWAQVGGQYSEAHVGCQDETARPREGRMMLSL